MLGDSRPTTSIVAANLRDACRADERSTARQTTPITETCPVTLWPCPHSRGRPPAKTSKASMAGSGTKCGISPMSSISTRPPKPPIAELRRGRGLPPVRTRRGRGGINDDADAPDSGRCDRRRPNVRPAGGALDDAVWRTPRLFGHSGAELAERLEILQQEEHLRLDPVQTLILHTGSLHPAPPGTRGHRPGAAGLSAAWRVCGWQ